MVAFPGRAAAAAAAAAALGRAHEWGAGDRDHTRFSQCRELLLFARFRGMVCLLPGSRRAPARLGGGFGPHGRARRGRHHRGRKLRVCAKAGRVGGRGGAAAARAPRRAAPPRAQPRGRVRDENDRADRAREGTAAHGRQGAAHGGHAGASRARRTWICFLGFMPPAKYGRASILGFVF